MADEYVRMKKSTLTAIGDSIRKKEESTELIPPLEMPARIEAINGGVNYLDYCVSFNMWSLNLFGASKVEITLPKVETLRLAFVPNKNDTDTEGRKNITVKELIVHCPNIITDMFSSFGPNNYYRDSTLKKITLDFEVEDAVWEYAFNNLTALEIIDGIPINLSSIWQERADGMFGQCLALVEARFKGILSASLSLKYSKDLSKASILSLMACRSPEASGKTITFNKEAVDKAFETSPGAADGSTSAEWLALVEAYSNWTIALWEG